jgi:hypothetical protein
MPFGFKNPKNPNQRREKLSNDANVVYNGLKDLYWPCGSDADLARCIELSFRNYTVFRNKWARKHQQLLQVDEALTRHFDNVFAPVSDFVQTWFLTVNQRIENWAKWHGKLDDFVFTPDREEFWKWGKVIAYDFCGNSNRFTKLMEVLNHAN